MHNERRSLVLRSRWSIFSQAAAAPGGRLVVQSHNHRKGFLFHSPRNHPVVTLVVPFLSDESKTKTASISNFTPIVENAVQMSLRLGKPPYDLMAFVVGDLVSVGH